MSQVAEPASRWRNRIVRSGTAKPSDLLANPLNWRVHSSFQRDAVTGALGEIGWIQQAVVNEVTGRMIDGHLRVEEALRRGEPEVPVLYVELTEDEERLALATLDPLGALAIMDGTKLTELMEGVTVGNEALGEFLGGLRQDAGELKMSTANPGEGRDMAPRDVAVKAVIVVSDLAIVEAAISKAGHPVRGDALVAVCKAFLEKDAK